MALEALIWQTKRGYSTTLNTQNHTSSFPSVLSDVPLASILTWRAAAGPAQTAQTCCKFHVSMSPCFMVLL